MSGNVGKIEATLVLAGRICWAQRGRGWLHSARTAHLACA